MNKLFSLPFIVMILFYQKVISPYFPMSCRYSPTCSKYSLQCFKKHNVLKALFLTIKRIISCNPWGGHGHDPVP